MPDYTPPVEDIENCILGICCNPMRRRDALAQRLEDEVHLNKNQAKAVADWINDMFDLAPKDMLQPLYQYIAALARQYPYQG